MRKRRIAYLSGTRADFGLMQSTLQRISAAPSLSIELLLTGMHLSEIHGNTVQEIRGSGLSIAAEIPLDMSTRTGKSMALGVADCLLGVTEALVQNRPDLLLLLGDRGEMLAGAIAALHLGIPTVHIHGGERSGTVDEPVRHAISKLATYHFVATTGARERLITMGEDPSRIHVTGAPGLDDFLELGTLSRDDCLRALGLPLESPFGLVIFHPVVQQANIAYQQAMVLARVLSAEGMPLVWLEPNADAGALGVLQALEEVRLPAGSRRVTHLDRFLFASAVAHCEWLAGNSSAGIIEAASFGTPVLNVGDRQRLREHAENVVDVSTDENDLSEGLSRVRCMKRRVLKNPYGDGKASGRIVSLLKQISIDHRLLEKSNTY
ncbi:MAG: UDP-N-acetylglucosamine 2-epimerase [Fluviibacter sp.]